MKELEYAKAIINDQCTSTRKVTAISKALIAVTAQMEEITKQLFEKGELLEAERQRADEARKTCDMYRDKFLSAEEELAALKGEQVPVSITDDMAMAFHAATTDSALGRDDMEEIKAGLQAVQELFTAPQKPVVLPKLQSFLKRIKDKETGEIELHAAQGYYRSAVIAAIEAAGGTVKDGA